LREQQNSSRLEQSLAETKLEVEKVGFPVVGFFFFLFFLFFGQSQTTPDFATIGEKIK